MELLILDGIDFVGRHITQAAINTDHQVTLFNRNIINPHLFPEAKRIIGNRFKSDDMQLLKNQQWDAVIDLNGYSKKTIIDACEVLEENVNHYIYLSSASVYDLAADLDSLTLHNEITEHSATDLTSCENAVKAYFPNHHTILRPGFITGPYDNTDRLTYWLNRIARGGEVLVPQRYDDRFQMIDARDLANFVINSCEAKTYGIFNIAGPQQTWGQLLESCRRVTSSNAVFTWINHPTFFFNNIGKAERPLGSFPLVGLHRIFTLNSDKAMTAGLQCRALDESLSDTLAWQNTRDMSAIECQSNALELIIENNNTAGKPSVWMSGISAPLEKQLLQQWRDYLYEGRLLEEMDGNKKSKPIH